LTRSGSGFASPLLVNGPGGVKQLRVVQGRYGLDFLRHRQPAGRTEAQHVLAVLAE
jgi:hypothetical protein